MGKREIWRHVPGTTLRASNLGRIRNMDTGNVFNPYFVGKYPKITYKLKARPVAQLVILAWKGPAPTKHHKCSYLDFDPSNVTPSNLVWETQSESLRRQYKANRRSISRVSTRLSEQSANKIKQLHSAGWSHSAIARVLNINVGTVSKRSRGISISTGSRNVADVPVDVPQVRRSSNAHIVTYQGEQMCLSEWSRRSGLSVGCYYLRKRRGMLEFDALHTTNRNEVSSL